MFNIKGYAEVVEFYKGDFNGAEWIFVVIAILLVLVFLALFIVILLEQLKSAGGKAEPAVIAAVSSLICLLVFGPSNFILPSLMITVFLLTLLRNKLSPREADQNE